MTNYPIDGALAATEGAFEIDLLNKVTGTTYPQAAVYGTNTLGQVLQEWQIPTLSGESPSSHQRQH